MSNPKNIRMMRFLVHCNPSYEDKKGGKSAYDDMSEKKKKSDSDPTYSENMKLSIKIMERPLFFVQKFFLFFLRMFFSICLYCSVFVSMAFLLGFCMFFFSVLLFFSMVLSMGLVFL